MFKTWMSSVGEYGFMIFKSIAKKVLNYKVQLSSPKNLELIPKNLSVDMRLKPG